MSLFEATLTNLNIIETLDANGDVKLFCNGEPVSTEQSEALKWLRLRDSDLSYF